MRQGEKLHQALTRDRMRKFDSVCETGALAVLPYLDEDSSCPGSMSSNFHFTWSKRLLCHSRFWCLSSNAGSNGLSTRKRFINDYQTSTPVFSNSSWTIRICNCCEKTL